MASMTCSLLSPSIFFPISVSSFQSIWSRPQGRGVVRAADEDPELPQLRLDLLRRDLALDADQVAEAAHVLHEAPPGHRAEPREDTLRPAPDLLHDPLLLEDPVGRRDRRGREGPSRTAPLAPDLTSPATQRFATAPTKPPPTPSPSSRCGSGRPSACR